MNKQEFKSAYNKIALSEEFKAGAKAKLLEQYASEARTDDSVTEERVAAAITFTHEEKRRSPWRAVLGIGSAAAVVGLGIWGGSVLLNQQELPLDGLDTVEAVQTAESTEYVQSAEAPDVTETAEDYSLVSHSVVLAVPSQQWEQGTSVFTLDISLPEGWEIEEGTEAVNGAYPVNITEGGEIIGTVDCNSYVKYDGPEYGEPDYYRMVFGTLMMGSRVSWDSDYTPVKTDGWLTSATCQVMANESEAGYNDNIVYYDGILAYEDALSVYVNIMFSEQIEEGLHTAIAESADISFSNQDVAEKLTEMYLSAMGKFDGELKISAELIDTVIGKLVVIRGVEADEITSAAIFMLDGMRIVNLSPHGVYFHLYSFSIRQSPEGFSGDKGVSIRFSHEGQDYDRTDLIIRRENGSFVTEEYRMKVNIGGASSYSNVLRYDADVGFVSAEKSEVDAALEKIGNAQEHIANSDFNNTIYFWNVTDPNTFPEEDGVKGRITRVIRNALEGTDLYPQSEPLPKPPYMFLDFSGGERELFMGEYTWQISPAYNVRSEEWNDALTGKLEAYGTRPSTWVKNGEFIVPEGGSVASVTLCTNRDDGVPLELSRDGRITLPENCAGGVTYYIVITVEYKDYLQGVCDYILPIYFPTVAEPPELLFAADGELHPMQLGSAYWHAELKGNSIGEEKAYQMFLDGEISVVRNCSEVRVDVMDGRMIEAVHYETATSYGKRLDSSENGTIALPTGTSGVVRVSVEFPDGSASYWFGFDNTELASLPARLTAQCGAEFVLSSGSGWKWNYDMGYCTFAQGSTSFSVSLPEGVMLVEAYSENPENYRQPLDFTVDGTVWLPYYQRFAIYVVAEDIASGDRVEYGFMYESNSAPAVNVTSGAESAPLMCGEWSYRDEIWGGDIDSSVAFSMLGEDIPRIGAPSDTVQLEITKHNKTGISAVTAYDKNGNAYELSFTEEGMVTLPEAEAAVIRVELSCFEGTAAYWFGYGSSAPVNLPETLTAVSGGEEFKLGTSSDGSLITLPENSFRINIPEGASLTYIYEGEYENQQVMAEDGTIYLPYFKICEVYAVVEHISSGEKAVYSFKADCRRAPEITIQDDKQSITPLCVMWSYYDDVWGADITPQEAFASVFDNTGKLPDITTHSSVLKLLRPVGSPSISSVKAYDMDGNEYPISVDGGELARLDFDILVYRVELSSAGSGSAVYWFCCANAE